ncbi:MAG: DUF4248 domain-containing protein [Bacteroidales bacterium]|nr:DUF4248 domain-containing protein [Bacteroidales bacterium]
MSKQEYQPMTIGQLAERWHVDPRTARRWIRPFYGELGRCDGRIFTPKQVEIILGHLE